MPAAPRDPRASVGAVDKALTRFATELPNLEGLIDKGFDAGPLRRVAPLAAKLLIRSTHQIRVAYAAGTPVDQLVPLLHAVGDRWSRVFAATASAPSDPGADRYLGPELLRTLPGYAAVVDLLAWSRALGVASVVEQVAATAPVIGTTDVVLDTLVGRPGPSTGLPTPAPLGDLFAGWGALAAAAAPDRPAALASYVSGWEQAWIVTGAVEPPGSEGFVGHWCFDVAPLVMALDVDDTAVRDLPTYPRDLIDAARRASRG